MLGKALGRIVRGSVYGRPRCAFLETFAYAYKHTSQGIANGQHSDEDHDHNSTG